MRIGLAAVNAYDQCPNVWEVLDKANTIMKKIALPILLAKTQKRPRKAWQAFSPPLLERESSKCQAKAKKIEIVKSRFRARIYFWPSCLSQVHEVTTNLHRNPRSRYYVLVAVAAAAAAAKKRKSAHTLLHPEVRS